MKNTSVDHGNPTSPLRLLARGGMALAIMVLSHSLCAQDMGEMGEMGSELQSLERAAASPRPIAPAEPPDVEPAAALINPPQPVVQPPAGAEGETIALGDVAWRGDVFLVETSAARGRFLAALQAGPMTIDAASAHMAAMQQELVENGFFLARVWMEFGEGASVLVMVDGGLIGEIRLHRMDQPYRDLNPAQRRIQRKPYKGYFSQTQIERRLMDSKPGEPFNYNTLHRQLFDVNTLPDLTVNTDLRIRTEQLPGEEPSSRRYMDLHYYVEDRIPIHGVIEYKNTGTKTTERERLILTLQHLNLTRHDDALTVTVPLSMPDPSVLQAVSANYILPHYRGKGGGLSLFGGFSRLNVDHVVQDVHLDADGHFVGSRVFQRIVNTPDHLVNVALGLTYRKVEDQVDYDLLDLRQDSGIELLPLSASLIYASNRPDVLRGRNYATLMSSYNIGADWGVTDEEDVAWQKPGARDDFLVHRMELSRIQSLMGSFNPRSGMYEEEWYVFATVSGQYSDDPLVATEQLVVGGFETVRGYPERESIADRGVFGTFEFRTPVVRGVITRAFVDRKDVEEVRKMPVDYVQGLVFVDAGRVSRMASGDEGATDTDLLSVGVGMRLSAWRFAQFKLDYGWPLEDTANSSSSGRFHFSLQAQF